jgi:hypothetical protein
VDAERRKVVAAGVDGTGVEGSHGGSVEHTAAGCQYFRTKFCPELLRRRMFD